MFKKSKSHRSIRYQLLSVTSVVTVAFVIALIVIDYRREVRHHFAEKQSDLYEEAKTVLPGVVHTREHGNKSVQKFIDSICNRMDVKHSPNHHIIVKIAGDMLQANTHFRASPELLAKFDQASQQTQFEIEAEGNDLLVGRYSEGDVTVIVSEDVASLRSAVIGDELFRVFGIVLMGIAAATIVHLLLVRLVSRPLDALVEKVKSVGQGIYDTPLADFESTELHVLSTEITAMSEAIAYSENDRKSRLKKARDIQQNLLPNDVKIPGVSIAITYNPAEEVGGDYLDILPQSNNRWLVCVADATGHGVPAAMSAAMLKTMLLQASERSDSPAEILSEMNRVFMQVQIFGDFASLILIEIDLAARTLSYANAGHDPAWLMKATGEVLELEATGTLLGIDEDAVWEEEFVDLTEGSRLAISTDGITETFGADDEMFSKERLLSTLRECRNRSLAQTNENARQLVDAHRANGVQTDDVTLLLMEFGAFAPLEKNDSNELDGFISQAFQSPLGRR
ncbi:PP2C family protein-serine/threonine phosphatase [Rubripirellula reticaptiva]|uniref:Phosphoserine phosphatase RsbU n=1 Tax=Rubripirellula reticaptiva TaxID=2528013 RepID=A0A5C6EVA7_9BACT|nr:PP2C family protein-serine/threonine phosphatase [Rubripirellula reticaptiva]TWU51399.1 Phosphoserine phosphatase RsbU [Rubripirellula reticaptiva]